MLYTYPNFHSVNEAKQFLVLTKCYKLAFIFIIFTAAASSLLSTGLFEQQ